MIFKLHIVLCADEFFRDVNNAVFSSLWIFAQHIHYLVGICFPIVFVILLKEFYMWPNLHQFECWRENKRPGLHLSLGMHIKLRLQRSLKFNFKTHLVFIQFFSDTIVKSNYFLSRYVSFGKKTFSTSFHTRGFHCHGIQLVGIWQQRILTNGSFCATIVVEKGTCNNIYLAVM